MEGPIRHDDEDVRYYTYVAFLDIDAVVKIKVSHTNKLIKKKHLNSILFIQDALVSPDCAMTITIENDPLILSASAFDQSLPSHVETGLEVTDLNGQNSQMLNVNDALDSNFERVYECQKAWNRCESRSDREYIGYSEWRMPHISHLEVFYRKQNRVIKLLFTYER